MRVTHFEEARMRGDDRQQAGMWSYLSPEPRVPSDHPLRPIRAMVDAILVELSPEFAKLYSPVGRPSIPPEKLLRALLLQVLYSTRSERLLRCSATWRPARVTVGADKGYDTRDFVQALRLVPVTSHVAGNTTNRSSAIDRRTTRHAGYGVSQWKRKRVEEIFGWLKTVCCARRATVAGPG
jgi:hypothetical protein